VNNFVFITPAYNCESKIDLTIRSAAMQTYENWRMYIVNDMSTDGTIDAIKKSCKKYGLKIGSKVEIIDRQEKFGEVRNTIDICEKLDERDIVVRLDAGDWLTDMGCLEMLNMVYSQHDPAVMWTNQRWSWTNHSICGPIDPAVSVYGQPWRSSHLKTFRVKDFIGINPKNFMDDSGEWIVIACDQAIFLPMMERARRNARPLIYFPMVMYHYDIDLQNPELFKQDRSIKQKMSAERIRERGYIE